MEIYKMKKYLLALIITAILSGCGGGGSSDSNGGATFDDATTQGKAAKGIIIKGDVVASELDGAGTVLRVVGNATTGPDGSYNLDLNDSYEGGPIEIMILNGPDTTTVCDVVVGCGPRTDGLTSTDDPDNNDDLVIDFGEEYKPSGFSMTALIPNAEDGESIAVQVTPFTHMAAERAKSETLTAAVIEAANSEVSNLLSGIDILRTEPVDITSTSSLIDAEHTAIAYAALAAAIANLAPVDSDGQPDIDQALSDLVASFDNGTISAADLQEIVDEANNTLAEVGATDTSGVLADLEDDIILAAGGDIDPEPNPNAGDTDVEKAKNFLADLRTWGTVIGDELDSPSQAFQNQIELSDAAADMIFSEDVAGEAIGAGADVISYVNNGGIAVVNNAGARQCSRGNAIAFDDAGTLFWANDMEVSELNSATGLIIGLPVPLDFSPFGPAGFRVVAMDYHPMTGDLYAAVQQRQAGDQPPPKSTLAILDPLTGSFTMIGAVDGTGVKLDGIAFTSTGILYGTSTGFGTGDGGGNQDGTGPGQFSLFHQVDITTGVATQISTDIGYGGGVGGLAANSDNVLFAGRGGRGPNSLGKGESESLLFTIDPDTGVGNPAIGPLGIEFGPGEGSLSTGDFDQFGSLSQRISGWSFDPISDNLYGMAAKGAQLFITDTATGLATRVGTPCDSVDYVNYLTDSGLLFTGMVSVSSSNGQSTYTISNADVSDDFDGTASLHMVATAPDEGTSVSTITLGVLSAVAQGFDTRVVVDNGTIEATLPSPYEVDYSGIPGTEPPAWDSMTMDLDVIFTQRLTIDVDGGIENAADPVTFAGNLVTTVYPYIDPTTGEIEEALPGSLTMDGNVSNTTGDSVDINLSVSIPEAAFFAANPVTALPIGSTYAENNSGNQLVSWTYNGNTFIFLTPSLSLEIIFTADDSTIDFIWTFSDGSQIIENDRLGYTSVQEFVLDFQSFINGNIPNSADVDGQGYYLRSDFASPNFAADGFVEFTLDEPEIVFFDVTQPLEGAVGLQFTAQLEGLPEANISITGNATAFEQGNATVTISYDTRRIELSASNDTADGELGSIDITNQDGVMLTLNFDNLEDADLTNDTSDVTINGKVVATIEELSNGGTKVSYIDGTFEIF